MIRIAFVEDHLCFRQGLSMLLHEDPDFKVVLETGFGEELEAKYNPDEIDIVLLDLNLEGQSGIITCQNLFAKYPEIRIIILSFIDDHDFIVGMAKYGASGYLSKGVCITTVKRTIRIVHELGHFFEPSLGEILRTEALKNYKRVRNGDFFIVEFDYDEIQLAVLHCCGYSIKEIAEIMRVSEKTVDNRKNGMMTKTDLRTFIEVIMYMCARKIIFPENLNPAMYTD